MRKKFHLKDLKGKKIAVVGLGKTGLALARFLLRCGAKVLISERKSAAELPLYEEAKSLSLEFELEGHSPKSLKQQDYVILSPGVPSNLRLFDYIRSRGAEVTGEFEFASRYVREKMAVITGTNGKTAVLEMAALFLRNSGVNVWTGGNYKTPLSQYLYEGKRADVLLVEASSFMLESVQSMTPGNIVVTNISESHRDRYLSMEDYIAAKKNIFANTHSKMTSILNADSPEVIDLARDPVAQRGRIFYFSRKKSLKPQVMSIGGAVALDGEVQVRTRPEIEYYSLKKSPLIGPRSHENIMAAILTAKENGGSWQHIQRGIDEYRGSPHRLEYVRRVGGVLFYNDSKATNVQAVGCALEAFEGNVILIMGGRETGLDYTPLADLVRRKVKTLILIGEAKEMINRHIGGCSETFLVGTFDEAVYISYNKSRIGDIALLSPGCPSFDMFSSYEERGRRFRQIVNQFK